MNVNEIYKKAIEIYGEREQSAMAMEECGELIRAINKYHRKDSNENRKNLIEEIADVRIMIEQLKIMYSISEDEIEDAYLGKVFRLIQRLEGA